MKVLRAVAFLAVVFSAGAGHSADRPLGFSQLPERDKSATREMITPSELEGVWGRQPPTSPSTLQTFEFRHDGTCKCSNFGEVSGIYGHSGDSLTIISGPLSTTANGASRAAKAQVRGDTLTLQLFGDLPPCPFHRIGSVSPSSDPLIGTWGADACNFPTPSATAWAWKGLVSNALYTFAANHTMRVRYRLEEVARYSIQDEQVSCPVFENKDYNYTLTLANGTPILRGKNSTLVKQTPAEQLAYQFNPGDLSDENIRRGNEAIADFRVALKMDPNNLHASDGAGSLLFSMGFATFDTRKFDEAKTYYQRHVRLRPEDPEPYYWIGVIDYAIVQHSNAEMRQKYSVENPTRPIRFFEPLPDNLRQDFTQQYAAAVDEGLKMLQKAIEGRLDYADALALRGLLLRQKADQADDIARVKLEKEADDAWAKAIAAYAALKKRGEAGIPPELYLFSPRFSPPAPTPPPLDGTPLPPDRIRLNGVVQETKLLSQVQPVYPTLARQARIEGSVVLHAIIGKDGTVKELQVISGHPLLVQPALDAVRKWRYQPTELNGEPVEVDTTIAVTFVLGG
jgi:TonB family protein